MPARHVLFVLRHAPYDGAAAWEALDAMLVTGVFDQQVSALFLDDAVWQLLPDQQADRIGRRNVGKALTALPDYGIEQLFVSSSALAQRGIDAKGLAIPVTLVSETEAASLIQRQDVVLSG